MTLQFLAVPLADVESRESEGWRVSQRADGRVSWHGIHGIWMEREDGAGLRAPKGALRSSRL